jgi:hypothetical protein
MSLDFETVLQIGAFAIAFGVMALAFLSDTL